MSWDEYKEDFKKAQKTGDKQLFVFDMKGSRKVCAEKKNRYMKELEMLLYRVYFKIMDIEISTGKEILHKSEFLNPIDTDFRADTKEPIFFMGDLLVFTVKRDSISKEEVYRLFKESKKDLGLDYEFYYATGYYETDEWGGKGFFRGYCIPNLEAIAKKRKKTI